MRIEVTLGENDLRPFLDQITPMRIALGGERCLYVGKPQSIVFIPGEGVRVVARARIRWEILSVGFPIVIPQVSLTLRPKVVRVGTRDSISFSLHVDNADFRSVPSLVDRGIVFRINKYLESGTGLLWDMHDALQFSFKLPENLAPASSIGLTPARARVRVRKNAIVLSTELHARVQRQGGIPQRARARGAPILLDELRA